MDSAQETLLPGASRHGRSVLPTGCASQSQLSSRRKPPHGPAASSSTRAPTCSQIAARFGSRFLCSSPAPQKGLSTVWIFVGVTEEKANYSYNPVAGSKGIAISHRLHLGPDKFFLGIECTVVDVFLSRSFNLDIHFDDLHILRNDYPLHTNSSCS